MSFFGALISRSKNNQRAIEAYNLGLDAKYAGRWRESLEQNQLAAKLNPEDEASWWNLAIAATALHEWDEARRAWLRCGVPANEGEGEVTTPQNWACVRLVPDGAAEVVWGRRIDPARITVMNIPRPESGRLYGDIILNDGAQEGTRVSKGEEFPVFNELAVWRRSDYSTYEVHVEHIGDDSRKSIERICEAHELYSEDWGTLRVLCEACSRGNPGEHQCIAVEPEAGSTRFGFAAKTRDEVVHVLAEWREVEAEIRCSEPELVVAGGLQ